MKKFILVCLFLSITRFAFADVTATVIGNSIDDNGAIVVKTQYKIDGMEVSSPYPKVDGKYCFWTRYDITNFANMDNKQIESYILKDITNFSETLIRKKYIAIQNALCNLTGLINKTSSVSTADILVDTNNDGQPDTKWIVKTDGDKTTENYEK